MSRVGRKAITVPAGVKVSVAADRLDVQGPKGKLTTPVPPGIKFALDKAELTATRADDERQSKAFHGLARALAQNAITGVTQGFSKELDIVGVGYKAAMEGKKLVLNLGFSHQVFYPVPEGITIAVDKSPVPGAQSRVVVSGIDRQRVGQVAAEIRKLRKPDPYKQKGIRYVGEVLKKKAGKAGATGAK
jgi:large subunit ribosomal protein L6